MSLIDEVLRHSGELQQARSLADLMRVTQAAVKAMSRYRSAWIAWFDPEHEDTVRVLAVSGTVEVTWANAPRIPIAGDPMIAEILRGRKPVIVEDARVDPRTNKDVVAQLGNRTIINIPIVLNGTVRGCLGAGSFGDEGVVAPLAEELESFVIFASQLAPAFDRVEAVEAKQRAEKERQLLEQRLHSLERVELIGVLAAGVAHDLNNLLSVVMMSLDLVHVDPSRPHDKDNLGDASRALERMGNIARQLLQLGKDERPHEALDLNARVASTISLVRPSIPRGVKLIHVNEGLPTVEGDGSQLEQVLANLVLNARDAVGELGTITLAVDERAVDDVMVAKMPGARRGRFARVCVSDTGPGLTPEVKDRVFDPLFTTKPFGTGLGLAVVSRITAQHHGFVAVESEPGQGTRFEVYLPAL